MTIKNKLSLIVVSSATIIVLYSIMKYAAPNQLADITERISGTLNNSSFQDETDSKGGMTNLLNSSPTIDEIIPTRHTNLKVDFNNLSKNSLAGFSLGQGLLDANICTPKTEYVDEEDGKPWAKTLNCSTTTSNSNISIMYADVNSNTKIVQIIAVVPIVNERLKLEDVEKLLVSKYGTPTHKSQHEDFGYYFEFEITPNESLQVSFKLCSDWQKYYGNSKDLPEQCQSGSKNISMITYAYFYGIDITKLAYVDLNPQEYNIRAKELGIAPIRDYEIVNYEVVEENYKHLVEPCLQYVDSLNTTDVDPYNGSEKKTQVKFVELLFGNLAQTAAWSHQYGDNFVLLFRVWFHMGVGYNYQKFPTQVCVVNLEGKLLGVEDH